VRVDPNAKPGPAVVRVEFPKGAPFRSFPTDIPVRIE
jgi:hypothetical protein